MFDSIYTPELAAAEVNRKASEHGQKPTITAAEIRNAIRNGELAHSTLARGKWVFSEAQFTAWLESRTHPATAGAAGRPERQPIGVTQRSANHTRRARRTLDTS